MKSSAGSGTTGKIGPERIRGAWPGTSPVGPAGWSLSRFSTAICGLPGIRRLRRAQPGRHPRPPRRRDCPRHHRHRRRPERRSRGRHRHVRARCRRAIKAAATAHQYTGNVIAARQARQILANPQLAVYDNPNTLLMCVYKRDKALCHRGIKDTPSLDQCVPTCANIARTDRHAAGLRRRATVLDRRAAQVPGPLGERLRSNAGRLRDLADAHRRAPHHCPRKAPDEPRTRRTRPNPRGHGAHPAGHTAVLEWCSDDCRPGRGRPAYPATRSPSATRSSKATSTRRSGPADRCRLRDPPAQADRQAEGTPLPRTPQNWRSCGPTFGARLRPRRQPTDRGEPATARRTVTAQLPVRALPP